TECQLYGAMDGAMKFIKGDTIAGLVITAINLIGGFAIGMLRMNMTAGDAAQVYSILTIGDGLVAQIPSVLITLCAGVIITRVSNQDGSRDSTLGHTLRGQLFAYPKPIALAGGFILVLGLLPEMPTLVFFFLGGSALGIAYLISRPYPANQAPELESDA